MAYQPWVFSFISPIFKPWMGFEIIITNNAETSDTIREIIALVNHQSKEPFVVKFAQALRPEGSKLQYIHRLFEFICKNVEYEMDPPGWEKLYTVGKLFIEAKGDCKKMTIAIASVLKAAGIEPLFKVISYNGRTWEHIYVITKISNTYYVLDPVNSKKFNAEIDHKKYEVFNLLGNSFQGMTKLSILGKHASDWFQPMDRAVNELAGDLDQVSMVAGRSVGMGCDCGTYKGIGCAMESGIGLKNKFFEFTASEGVKHTAAVVAEAPMRAAFLGLLYLGKLLAHIPAIRFYLPHRIALAWNGNPNKWRKWWWMNGGEADASALRTALVKVVGGTIAGASDMQMYYGEGYDYPLSIDPFTVFPGQAPRVLQRKGVNGMGIGEPVTLATAAAAVVAATPLIVAAKNLLKEAGVFKEGDTDPIPNDSKEVPAIPPVPANGGPKPTIGPGFPVVFHPIKDDPKDDKDDNSTMWLVGGAAALYLLSKK